MDKKEASFILANIDRRVCDDELNEALDMAIKALEQEPKTDTWSIKDVANTFKKHGLIVEQEPCEDAISRQDVLDLAKKGVLISNGSYKSVCKAINEVPSAEPKTGHWTHDGSHWENRFICSECEYKLFEEQTNYCPNCGARMESEEV